MALKKRYDNLVSNSQSLKRIFSSSNASKYPTLGKFLPAFSKQTVVYTSDDDEKLNLLDNLINQTLTNQISKTDAPVGSVSIPQSPARAKETLSSQLPAENTPQAELAQIPESQVEAPAEVVSNPELVELSQEIKEVSKESKEQREQALIKEKQQEIDKLATEAVTPVAVSNKPVVVLPITAKSKEEAKFKSTKYSVRWLVEWCKKIAKMFSGAVVYKEEVDYE